MREGPLSQSEHVQLLCSLSFTQCSYRWEEAPAEFTAPLRFPAVSSLDDLQLTNACIADGIRFRSGRSSEATHVLGIAKGRRWQQQQPQGRSPGPRVGEEGAENEGGGGGG
jgi:hypothetical protein